MISQQQQRKKGITDMKGIAIYTFKNLARFSKFLLIGSLHYSVFSSGESPVIEICAREIISE